MVRGANSTPPPPAAWLQYKFPLSSPHQCLHLLSSALTSPCCSRSAVIPVMVRYSLLCIVSISVVRLVLAGPCVWCHDPGPVVPPQLGAAPGWSHNYSIVCSRPAPAADTPQQYTHAADHRVQGDESVGDFMCIFCIKHVFTYPSCSI